MSPRDLSALFAPASVAVVGASRDAGKLGHAMTRALDTFDGPVVGVNPRDPDPAAHRYESLTAAAEALGRPLDLAVCCVPASACAAAVADAADAGVRAALVCAGGFAETGGDGIDRQRELATAAADAGIALLGPNTSGFLVPGRSLYASFVPDAQRVPAGPVAVVAASGGVNHALAYLLADAGVGVSLGVGIGNGADVTAVDVLHHLAHDEQTRAVVLHVESVADGPALVDAVAAVSRHKPVVALVVGRAEVGEFARSHTGALATSWRTTRAALQAAGAVLVDDERELVDAAHALAHVRLPAIAEPGTAVISAQAGPALLHIDALRSAGLSVPPLHDATQRRLAELLPPLTYQANPVDTGRPGDTFGDVVRTVAADAAVDLITCYTLVEPDAVDLADVLPGTGAPLVVGLGGTTAAIAGQRDRLRQAGIPVVTTPAALTTAARALVADARGRALADAPPSVVVPALPDGQLDEDEAKTVLAELGVATPPRRACDDRAAAHRALAELGAPVAVKVLDAQITHKTDVGGVFLGVRTESDLDAALDALEAAGHRRVLLESMADGGVDLLVGASRDPVFGPVVLVGLGGVVAEALADVAVAPAPIGPRRAAALLDGLGGRALLDGFRGGPTVDRAALGDLLARLGQLLVQSPDVEAVEINPLRATADGRLVALDAVIDRTKTSEEAG